MYAIKVFIAGLSLDPATNPRQRLWELYSFYKPVPHPSPQPTSQIILGMQLSSLAFTASSFIFRNGPTPLQGCMILTTIHYNSLLFLHHIIQFLTRFGTECCFSRGEAERSGEETKAQGGEVSDLPGDAHVGEP